ncbi:MAG: aromatic amino acid ammonia-lyase, partial [Gammaproteobacteria bacterium]|nr:aromatic amino acid ammonia-lyase [Gammaproteobacteria bacterium]
GLLDKPLPAVPTLGNGSAGEIVPLSHLFGPLTEKLTLAEKERLALVNGSPCASALIADAVLAAKRRLDLALEIFALAADALKAPLEQFDSALDELWCDPHEAAVLQKMRYWLKDADQDRRSYQAPVSWRIVPRVAAQAHRTVAQAEGVASSSLRSVSDNPVFLPPNESRSLGRVLSNGGFHNAKAYPALDNLSACWADLALLCDRQITKLLDDNISLLPHQLMQGDGYVGCMGFGAADYAERARGCAQRTLLPGSEGGGFGQNDVAVPTFSASLKQAEAGRCLEACLAMLAAISSQAFFITERKAPPRLAALLEEIRDSFSPVTEARALGPDTERLAGKFTARVFAPSLA